ncbi:MAG: pyridoxal-dependent decarboxylase [Pseudomonadota bacterium]
MTEALDRTLAYTKSWLESLSTRQVAATADMETLLDDFAGPLPEVGCPAELVIDELAAKAEPGMHGSPSGRFFAWVIGGTLPSALAADWLVAAWDQNAALAACSPASAVIEQTAGRWLKEALRLPQEVSFAFTTGCQMAHVTGLAAARHHMLAQQGWEVEARGLRGAPPLPILASNNRHGSVERALRFLGLGTDSLFLVHTDERGAMKASSLATALERTNGKAIVCLNAADLNVATFDDFKTLVPMAKDAGAWVHIDGAFGLFARASRRFAHLAEGADAADSWSVDGHKWLNVPFDCGVSLIRHPDAHKAAMTLSASYIAPDASVRDQIDWNPEWSRRARSVPVYAALRELGRSGVEDLVDRCCDHCCALVEGIGTLPGAMAMEKPLLNQGLVRFERAGHSDTQNDAYTQDVIAAINKTGEAYFSGTRYKDRQAMRVSVVNWRTSTEDVERTIQAVKQVLVKESAL